MTAIPGVDYSLGRPSPTVLAQRGYRFACRYVSYSSSGKNLTYPEAIKLTDAGLSIVTNWENMTTDALGGYDAGRKHARDALAYALNRGHPVGRPIYFSVDFQVQSEQWPAVESYWHGLADEIGAGRVGVYGGYATIARAVASDHVRWYWQTYAWSGGRWHPSAHIRQVLNNQIIDGVQVDFDEAMTVDYGQWATRRGQTDMVDFAPEDTNAWHQATRIDALRNLAVTSALGEDMPIVRLLKDVDTKLNALMVPQPVPVDVTALVAALNASPEFKQLLVDAANVAEDT